MNAYIYHLTVGKRVGPSSNPNIQQTLKQLLLPFSGKYDQGLQGFDTQLARCHCLDLNPASAHWARRFRKTIHEAQADVMGLTKRPEMNITTENFAITRTWKSLWPKGRQLQHSKLAAQRRTQRARARYHDKISWQEREKMKKMATSDCKPRAQAIYALIPKTIGHRKRDCAWGCAWGINTTWENLQIEKHKSVRWAERTPSWFVLFDLQFFSGGVYSPSATSRTISFSISNSFWY